MNQFNYYPEPDDGVSWWFVSKVLSGVFIAVVVVLAILVAMQKDADRRADPDFIERQEREQQVYDDLRKAIRQEQNQ